MARQPRSIHGSPVYHLMNLAPARARCFHTDANHAAFDRVLGQSSNTSTSASSAIAYPPPARALRV